MAIKRKNEKRKKEKVRIVRPNNVNYTFINDDAIYIQSEDKNDENNNTRQKLHDIAKKSIKDLKTTKTHYKSNRSPKSQQIILPFTNRI